jgi:hypothetical protein
MDTTGYFALSRPYLSRNPRFGDSGRNILNQPGYQNWDIGAVKKTNIGDRITV